MKYASVKNGGARRIWDNGKIAVYFARSYDGTSGYDCGNYNAVAKDWNHMGYRFKTAADARKKAREIWPA